MCIHIYICIWICIFICIHIHMRIHIHIRMGTGLCGVQVYMCIERKCAYMRVCV